MTFPTESNPGEIIEVKEDTVATLDLTFNNNSTSQYKILTFHNLGNAIAFVTKDGRWMGYSLNFVSSWSIRIEDIVVK